MDKTSFVISTCVCLFAGLIQIPLGIPPMHIAISSLSGFFLCAIANIYRKPKR